MQSGIAYAVSKSFVRWFCVAQSERFGGKGARIVSVSPGSVDTEMGRLEAEAGAGAMVADAAVPRWGKPEEMAEPARVLRQRPGRLPHRHRHSQRRRSGRLDDGARQEGCRRRLARQSTSTQKTITAVAVASTVSRIVSLCRSWVASVFSSRSSRAIRNSGNATLIATRKPPMM